ncbi:MAG: hypothetical protein P1S60_19530 [Anaerolineae bacterium]|nr:hypothetical protein [Anaerolineae bacterium]
MDIAYIRKLRAFDRDVKLYLVSWSIIGFNHMGILSVLFNLYLLRLGLGYIGASAMMSFSVPVFSIFHQERVTSQWRATMAGAVNTATGLSGVVMAYGGALIVTRSGYQNLFLLTATLVGFGTLIFWIASQREAKINNPNNEN